MPGRHTTPPPVARVVLDRAPVRRRDLLTGTAALGALALATLTDSLGSVSSAPPVAIRGVDLSFLPQMERAGIVFRNIDGNPQPAEQILAAHGATHMRLRLWLDPADDVNSLKSMLGLALRARAAGMGVFASLHYSSTWADPRNQSPPDRWAHLDLDGLASAVEVYTRGVVDAFAQQGTPLELIQIGNEVDNGMLWPLGWLGQGYSPASFLRLIAAGMHGARTPDHGPLPRVVVHLSSGGDYAKCEAFFDQLAGSGSWPDLIAVSYYPFWNGSLRALRSTFGRLAVRYKTDLLIAETAYPWTLSNGDSTVNVVTADDQLPDGRVYPATPVGQDGYYAGLRSVVRDVPSGLGAGFVAWAPDWLPGVGLEQGAGNPHDNLTLFDRAGTALPAVRRFGP